MIHGVIPVSSLLCTLTLYFRWPILSAIFHGKLASKVGPHPASQNVLLAQVTHASNSWSWLLSPWEGFHPEQQIPVLLGELRNCPRAITHVSFSLSCIAQALLDVDFCPLHWYSRLPCPTLHHSLPNPKPSSGSPDTNSYLGVHRFRLPSGYAPCTGAFTVHTASALSLICYNFRLL